MSVAHLDHLPLGPDVTVLVKDEHGLAALAKPEGVLSQPMNDGKDTSRTLLQAKYDEEGECYHWTGEGGQPCKVWLINRLDSATSGVILIAATQELATEIRVQFKRKLIRKVYQAVVFGAPKQSQELWRDMLAVKKQGGRIRTEVAGNVPAEARMSVVRVSKGQPRLSLIKLEPRTGRSHQLRVQCAKRHLPIVGDQTYGNFEANRGFAKGKGTKRLFLHSYETSFSYDYKGRTVAFTARAPLPRLFETVL